MRYDLDAFLAFADGRSTAKEAAAALGITTGSVYARAAALRRKGIPATFRKPRSAGVDPAAFVAAVSGATAREAAARLGIGFSTVYTRATRLRRQGVTVPRFLRAARIPAQRATCPACLRTLPRASKRSDTSHGDPA